VVPSFPSLPRTTSPGARALYVEQDRKMDFTGSITGGSSRWSDFPSPPGHIFSESPSPLSRKKHKELPLWLGRPAEMSVSLSFYPALVQPHVVGTAARCGFPENNAEFSRRSGAIPNVRQSIWVPSVVSFALTADSPARSLFCSRILLPRRVLSASTW
jgi:hypothetical protein